MIKTAVILLLCYFAIVGCSNHNCEWGEGTLGHMIECEEGLEIAPCYGNECDGLEELPVDPE